MQVAELMTKPVVTIRATDLLSTAAENLWTNDCGLLPVVDGQGRLVGVITDRDICMSAWTRNRLLSAIRVSEAMSTDVFVLTPDLDITIAEALMSDKQVRRLPVVNADRHPIGIISINDLAREATYPDTRLRDGLSSPLHTLAAIGRPRPHREAA